MQQRQGGGTSRRSFFLCLMFSPAGRHHSIRRYACLPTEDLRVMPIRSAVEEGACAATLRL